MRLVRSNAQRSTAAALLDVQTMPPCRPQNAFRLAAELMYVTGVMSAVSSTSPNSSQQFSTCSIAAISAIEQPAAMSGSTTVTPLAAASGQPLGPIRQNIGRFGHEVDAAKRDRAAIGASSRHLAQLIAVALQVRERDHFVLLVMMPQDQQPRTPFCPNRRDAGLQLVVRERLVRLEFESGVGRSQRGHELRRIFQRAELASDPKLAVRGIIDAELDQSHFARFFVAVGWALPTRS